MKKLLAILLALCMVLALTACGAESGTEAAPAEQQNAAQQEENAEEASSGKPHYRAVYLFETVNEGLENSKIKMAEWLDAYNSDPNNTITLEIDILTCDFQLNTQIAQIEDAVVQGYDAILISAMDRSAVLPALEAAHDAGLKIIDSRAELEGDFIDVWVDAMDNVAMGQELKAWVKEYLDANPEEVLNVGIVWHDQTVTSCLPRCAGFVELAEEMPDRVKIVGEVYSNKPDVAQAAVEDWLVAYPEMNFVACSMDETARGAANAIKSAGIGPNEILISSVDGSKTATDLVEEGYLQFLIGFNVSDYMNANYQCIADALSGKFDDVEGTAVFKLADYTRIDENTDIETWLKTSGWGSFA